MSVLTEATAGRIQFIKSTSLHPQEMEWYQRPLLQAPDFSHGSGDIKRGFDFLTTSVALQRLRVPASMLGPGMEPFDEVVRFTGAPLAESTGNADTIMERLEDATYGKQVITQLVGFGNVSVEPITLRGTGAMAGSYYLYVTLSPTKPSFGRATYTADADGMSGWVNSEISLAPLFELRPVHGGESIFVDTGVTPVQGFPMGLTSDSSRWTRVPMTDQTVGWTGAGESLYYPGSVLILAKDQGIADETELARVKALLSRATLPDGHPEKIYDVARDVPGYISMCAKQSADYITC